MAIIYSYPINTNILDTDIIVGSSTVIVNGRPKNQTKSFEIQDLAAYFASVILPPGGFVPYTGAVGSVNLGAYNLTAASIIKAGGTNIQYLMADGSVTTGSTVPSAALTKTDDTNVTLTLGGSPATALLAATSLTLGWNGTLADSRITSAAIWNAKQDAITLTTTGTGAATLVANVLNIPTPPVSTGVTSVTGTSPIISSGGTAPAISIPLATSLVDGYLSAIDRTNFETAYINRITSLTTTGTGAATLVANVLNIPTPGSLTGFVPYTGATQAVNLGAFSLTANFITTTIDSTINGLTIGRGGGNVSNNTVLGYNALSTNTVGAYNSAIGTGALFSNTTGLNNTSIGASSLKDNTIGYGNTAVGLQSMFVNIGGIANTAIGVQSLYNVTMGNNNVGLGFNTTTLNPTDTNSIVIGYNATGIGSQSVVLGNTNILTTVLRGKVGIGTTVPQSNLHVVGNGITLSTADVTFGFGSIKTVVPDVINYPYEGDMVFSCFRNTGGIYNIVENLRIVARNGNVGIGTPSPTSKLQVVGLVNYASNAAAIAGGLTVGAFYHTGGVVKVVI